NYRERVAGWYNGWLHILLIYTTGFTPRCALVGISRHSYRVHVPNFFEWAVHRYVMHRPSNIPILSAIYSRHTLMHHQFFTEQEMPADSPGANCESLIAILSGG